jgi:membrane protein implicated in regulation of membrane protease activity
LEKGMERMKRKKGRVKVKDRVWRGKRESVLGMIYIVL